MVFCPYYKHPSPNPVTLISKALNGRSTSASPLVQVAWSFPYSEVNFNISPTKSGKPWSKSSSKKTDKRIPVIAGVAGTNISTATEHAAHAGRTGADAVIAMPPYMGSGGPDENLRYFEAISSAGQVPIFIQNAGAGMQPPALVRLLTEVEHLIYVKEEANPSAHHISAIVAEAGDHCQGVFGGAWCRWMISEMRRGASGFMPGAPVVDIHVDIWEAFQAGDEDRARDLFDQLLPLTNLIQILGLRLVKEVLNSPRHLQNERHARARQHKNGRRRPSRTRRHPRKTSPSIPHRCVLGRNASSKKILDSFVLSGIFRLGAGG